MTKRTLEIKIQPEEEAIQASAARFLVDLQGRYESLEADCQQLTSPRFFPDWVK